MSWFSGDVVEGIGRGVSKASEGIRYLLTGDLSGEVRVELEKALVELSTLEAKMLEGQVQMNMKEAESTSIFKSGWRPAIGWIGAFGLAYHFIVFPVLLWYIELTNITVNPPLLDSNGLTELVAAMLGIGGYRTYEKLKGITR